MRRSPMRQISSTALEEQLGLKLQPQKAKVPVLVIDYLERPTPNKGR